MPNPPTSHTVKVLLQAGKLSYPGANGGNVEIDAAGSTIAFEPSPGSDAFTFTGITFDPASTNFTPSALPAATLTVTDSDAEAGTYNYTLSVTANGQEMRSDPQIVNKS